MTSPLRRAIEAQRFTDRLRVASTDWQLDALARLMEGENFTEEHRRRIGARASELARVQLAPDSIGRTRP